MESKTCGSSGGFMTLLADVGAEVPARLAYMEDHGLGQVSFYELWNRPIWIEVLSATKGDVLEALRVGLASGELELRKHVRHMNGHQVSIKTFDMSQATIEVVGDETFDRLGTKFPKRLSLKGPEHDKYGGAPLPVKSVEKRDWPVSATSTTTQEEPVK